MDPGGINIGTRRESLSMPGLLNNKGFTLIEVLIVVSLVLLLVLIGIPNYMTAQIWANLAALSTDLNACGTALESFHQDHGYYPPDGRWQIRLQSTCDIGIKTDPPTIQSTNFWLLENHYWMTSPVNYLNDIPWDPFTRGNREEFFPGDSGNFSGTSVYQNIGNIAIESKDENLTRVSVFTGGKCRYIDGKTTVQWMITSFGPDLDRDEDTPVSDQAWQPYNPTNGICSHGDIQQAGPLPIVNKIPGLLGMPPFPITPIPETSVTH
jgi:prepilin-type N-terminal cleavage/methylation domain-containing protein